LSAAIFSLLGVVVGACLQYFFSKYLDDQRHQRSLRTSAYIDFLKCVGEIKVSAKERDARQFSEVLARLADAKTRICLYGSEKVVTALANFEHMGAVIKSADQRESFVRLVGAMRIDSGLRDRNLTNDEIEVIILGEDRGTEGLNR
jgi:hypothetical protein